MWLLVLLSISHSVCAFSLGAYATRFKTIYNQYKSLLTTQQTKIIAGTITIIGAMIIWRMLEYKKTEQAYFGAQTAHTTLQNQYAQEFQTIDDQEKLLETIVLHCNQRMEPIQEYYKNLYATTNAVQAMHHQLKTNKYRLIKRYPDIQEVLNNIARTHNNLYRLKKTVLLLIGKELHRKISGYYEPELTVLRIEMEQLSKTDSLLMNFDFDQLNEKLYPFVIQKTNGPEVSFPYLDYYHELSDYIQYIQDALRDIPHNNEIHLELLTLKQELIMIKKIIIMSKNYNNEKVAHKEAAQLSTIDQQLKKIYSNVQAIQDTIAKIRAKQNELNNRLKTIEYRQN